MNLLDRYKVMPILAWADNAGNESAFINMRYVHHATIIVQFGTATEPSPSDSPAEYPRLKVYSSPATRLDSPPTGNPTAITGFKAWRTNVNIGSANADVFSVEVTAATDGDYIDMSTTANFATRVLIIEVPASSLAEGHRLLSIGFEDDESPFENGFNCNAVAILATREAPGGTFLA
jgi:hypothetical protein